MISFIKVSGVDGVVARGESNPDVVAVWPYSRNAMNDMPEIAIPKVDI